MSDRIRQLEEALQISQLSCSPEPHPLLEPNLLNIKSTLTLYGDAQTGTSHYPESIPPPGDAQECVEPFLGDSKIGDQPPRNETSEKGCQVQVQMVPTLVRDYPNLILHSTRQIMNAMTGFLQR
jgi:hypothetical protein